MQPFLVTGPRCPQGFVKRSGDLKGEVGYSSFSVSSLSDCAAAADKEFPAKGFMYSKKHKKCKLLARPNPDGPPYEDYIFCQKEGTLYGVLLRLCPNPIFQQ